MHASMSENASSSHVGESRSLKLKSRGVGCLFYTCLFGLASLSVSDASGGSWTAGVIELIWYSVGLLLYLSLHLFDLEGLPLLFDVLLSWLEDLLLSLDLWGSLSNCVYFVCHHCICFSCCNLYSLCSFWIYIGLKSGSYNCICGIPVQLLGSLCCCGCVSTCSNSFGWGVCWQNLDVQKYVLWRWLLVMLILLFAWVVLFGTVCSIAPGVCSDLKVICRLM